MMTVVAFICTQLLLCSSSVEAQPTTIRPTTVPCNRLLMKGIDNDDLPWLQMAGIYHLANFTVDFFPVYKHESIDMYFYYNRSMKELRFGEPYQNTSTLVGAYTNGRTSYVGDYYSKPFNPFDQLITGWYQLDVASQQDVGLSGGKRRIEPTCIVDAVVTCLSGMIEFDDNVKQIDAHTGVIDHFNILGLSYYQQIRGFYLNNRPVYTRMRGDIDTQTYLYYREGSWFIQDTNTIYIYAFLKIECSAMRPEHCFSQWQSKTNGRYVSVDTKLRCRALTVDKACDANLENQCQNGGTCLTSSDGVNKYCGCPPGYRGLYCEDQMPLCPQPNELIDSLSAIEKSFHYFVPRLHEGSVLTIFRSSGSLPSYWFSTCDGSTWPNTTITILHPTTTSTTRFVSRSAYTAQTTKRRYIFDWDDPVFTTTYRYRYYTTPRYIFEWDDPVAATVIAVMVMIMQVLNPLIIWCVIFCVSTAREYKAEQKDNAELQNFYLTYQANLDIFRQMHPQLEEEYDAVATSELGKIHEAYERQSQEITERKDARKKSRRRVKLCRLFSLYAYCTFWIFLLYVILVCTTRLFGGTVFIILFIISAVFIFVSHLIVCLEYKWSSERQYLSNLSTSVFAVERIEAIRATRPCLFFRAESYHYETRTRTVYYTDVNGNLQSRQESYQAKVVTNLILDPVSFHYWRDTSPPELVGINDKGITKIKMTLSVEPGDEETRTDFDSKFQAFKDAHENLDVFVDFTIVKEVSGFEKRLAAYTDNREKPIWVSSVWFMVATFLFFGWPYRWAFKSITSKTEFAVSKRVYLSCPQEDNNFSGSISCITTGNGDSGGEYRETDSTAVIIDQSPTTTLEYVNPTYDASV